MEVATGAAGGGIPFCPGGGGSGVWFERSRAIEVFIKLPRPPLGGKSDVTTKRGFAPFAKCSALAITRRARHQPWRVGYGNSLNTRAG